MSDFDLKIKAELEITKSHGRELLTTSPFRQQVAFSRGSDRPADVIYVQFIEVRNGSNAKLTHFFDKTKKGNLAICLIPYFIIKNGTPGPIRTGDLRIRSSSYRKCRDLQIIQRI
jgi:hypothetical protein